MGWDKLLELLGQSKNPTMGEVKTTPEERFLNARPTLEQGYGDQQYIYDQLKDSRRDMAELGINLGEVNQEDVDREQMIRDSVGAGMGGIKKIAPELYNLGKFMAKNSITKPNVHESTIQALRKLREIIPKSEPLGRPISTGKNLNPEPLPSKFNTNVLFNNENKFKNADSLVKNDPVYEGWNAASGLNQGHADWLGKQISGKADPGMVLRKIPEEVMSRDEWNAFSNMLSKETGLFGGVNRASPLKNLGKKK